MKRVVATVLSVIVVVFGLSLLLNWVGGHSVPPAPLPSPNGYDDYLKAADLLVGEPPKSGNEAQLQAYVDRNREAFNRLRLALTRESQVPVEYTEAYMTNHVARLGHIKNLARALCAEGELAETQNRTNDAATAYIDVVRISHEATRGGLLIDSMVGVAMEAVGLRQLASFAPKLSAAQCRETVKNLEAVQEKRESLEEVIGRERQCSRKVGGWRYLMVRMVAWQSYQKSQQAFQAHFQQAETQRQKLILDLRARADSLEKDGQR